LTKNSKNQNKKTSTVYKVKIRKRPKWFGAILSRVEFQTGPYKTSHSTYLK